MVENDDAEIDDLDVMLLLVVVEIDEDEVVGVKVELKLLDIIDEIELLEVAEQMVGDEVEVEVDT